MNKRRDGFVHLQILLICVLVLSVVGFAGWRTFKVLHKTHVASSSRQLPSAADDRPLLLESVGFNLDYYNPSTNQAGDMEFTTVDHSLSGHNHQIWQDFGTQDYRSPNDPTKKNPQPTFVLPLHTKVQALVTGEVVDVKQLYSNDYTIWVARFPNSRYIYETEHVDNPLVKKGDHVVGGQTIGEVSSKDAAITPGFGLLEIGILYTAHNYPQHLCPFQYLDPAIQTSVYDKITALHASWETYFGQKVYLQDFVTPGCVTHDPVSG
ncbi:MAG TPA: hypothetical protein VLH84_02370 [Patescibacteria group bacterium]|nr:hypothetical protein [Patescibacteria group bacterium]